MSYRILHFADLHLDASFATAGMSPSVSKQRREDLRSSLKRIMGKAKELSVNAITIAGDLYEQERVSSDTLNFLMAQLAAIAPIPVIIAPGNHDPYFSGSPYHQLRWSSNVSVFSSPELSPYQLSSNITIWGAAHNSPSFRTNVVEHFRTPPASCSILLIHGSDTTRVPLGKEAHCPFAPDQIASSGAKFGLLGHYHKAMLIGTDKPICGYPGSPEPLGFDEEGSHYVILLDIDADKIVAQLIPVNTTIYRKVEIDVSSALSVEDIIQSIRALSNPDDEKRTMVRVSLEGELHPDVEMDLESIMHGCHDLFRFLNVENHSNPAYDLESIAQEPTVRGTFVSRMMNRIGQCTTDSEKNIVLQAVVYGLRALGGKAITPI